MTLKKSYKIGVNVIKLFFSFQLMLKQNSLECLSLPNFCFCLILCLQESFRVYMLLGHSGGLQSCLQILE